MICSAAIVQENEEALVSIGVAHFLTKPYHPENLLAHIRLELDGPMPSTSGHPRLFPSRLS